MGNVGGKEVGSYERGLQNLIHALGAEGAFDEVAHGDGTDKGSQPGIFTLFLGCSLFEDLSGAE